jgi:predicted membrane-bound spermidine synthase
MALLLYAVFILSGAAGLIYESIWSRYLGLFVGHSAYAQIIVLVIFLGGMSLGATLVGRRSEAVKQPLFWYAAIELLCGVIGLLFHDIYGGVTNWAYDAVFPSLGSIVMVDIVKWTIAALLILPQSILLGTTFPLMSAGVLRLVRAQGDARAGRVLSLLYFANSLGAAGGVLLAGFWLIDLAGLPGTLLAAAMLNLIVAAIVVVALRVNRGSADAAASEPAPAQAPSEAGAPKALSRTLLAVAFGTAAASFVYEIAWIRMLSLVLGSATHSFELMLSAFILGLALGAFWIRSRADAFQDPVRTLGIVQVVMGLLAMATMPIYLQSFSWQSSLLQGITATENGWRFFTTAKYVFSLIVMLPATFCAGITLPLITRVLLSAGAGERSIGAVYASNTLGSILGASMAGLVLLPLLGLKWLQIAGASVDIAFGLLLLVGVAGTVRSTRTLAIAGGGAFAAVALVALTVQFDTLLLTSGVFRHGQLRSAKDGWTTIYYTDGRTASVGGLRHTGVKSRSLLTNGKPDASLAESWLEPFTGTAPITGVAGDQAAQTLLPLITLAYRPEAKSVANIGQGSGISGHVLLGSPTVQKVTTIEIEPRMIDGSRIFYPANRRVFDDPRHSFVIDDAKSVFAASRQKFDLILSEPSNPWVSGVSGLFTDEFYQRVKSSMAPNGVLGQWLQAYETSDLLVLSVLAAVHRNFPYYVVHAASGADLLIIASQQPLTSPDWSVVNAPGVQEDLKRNYPLTPLAFEATRIADRASLAPLLDTWQTVNSDYYPIVDLGAERTRFLKTRAMGFLGTASDRFDIISLYNGTRRVLPSVQQSPAEMPRLMKAAYTERVRATVNGQPVDSSGPGSFAAVPVSAWEVQTFEAHMASGRLPVSWRQWATTLSFVDGSLHAASLGAVDEAFYGRVRAYLDRVKAPEGPRRAVEFLYGLGTLNFAAAAEATKFLEDEVKVNRNWVDPAVLRNAGVIARLKTGDVAGAERLLDELTLPAQREDARTLLLKAYVRAIRGPVPEKPAGS